jgi:hypothetical protein
MKKISFFHTNLQFPIYCDVAASSKQILPVSHWRSAVSGGALHKETDLLRCAAGIKVRF